MSQLNFTITATEAEFDDFANRLGYMETLMIDDVPTANPESRSQYLERILKEKVAAVFYNPFVTEISDQVVNTRETEKETMREVVRQRVTVSFVV